MPQPIYKIGSEFQDWFGAKKLGFKSGRDAFTKQDGGLKENYFQKAFGSVGIPLDTKGAWTAHHIIPLDYAKKTKLLPPDSGSKQYSLPVYGMLQKLTVEGYFSVVDGQQNLTWLPTYRGVYREDLFKNVRYELLTGLARHAGGHTAYSDAVGRALDSIQKKIFGGNDATNSQIEQNIIAASAEALAAAGAEIAGLQAYIENKLLPHPELVAIGKFVKYPKVIEYVSLKLTSKDKRPLNWRCLALM
jgi:A nuclease family of the HNH/ENDO VII superfamily with conserved AHH